MEADQHLETAKAPTILRIWMRRMVGDFAVSVCHLVGCPMIQFKFQSGYEVQYLSFMCITIYGQTISYCA